MNENAKTILTLIQQRLQKYPSERFTQALFNLNITQFADTKNAESKGFLLRNIYNDDDVSVLERIQEKIKYDESLSSNKQNENERCISALQKIVQKKIVPIDPVFVIGHLCTVDAAIDFYIEKLERENKELKNKIENGN